MPVEHAPGRVTGLYLRKPEQRAHHRERQRLVVRAPVLSEHRYSSVDPVLVRDRVEVPGARRGSLEVAQIGAVAGPRGELDRPVRECTRLEHRGRQRAAGARVAVARQVVPEHDRPPLDRPHELRVVVEARPQRRERRLKVRHVLQRAFREAVENPQPAGAIGLGEHDVEAEDRDAVPFEKLVDQAGHDVAAPRPLPELGRRQALLVDVEDDDALVDAPRHRQPQPRVVDDAVELVDERDAIELTRRGRRTRRRRRCRARSGRRTASPAAPHSRSRVVERGRPRGRAADRRTRKRITAACAGNFLRSGEERGGLPPRIVTT